MLKILFQTKDEFVPFLLRVILGVVMFPHGAGKVLGWFGGYGLKATINAFTQNMHIPLVFALLAIASEFLGSIFLFLGFATRIAAFGIAVIMIVAVKLVHFQYGLFMNWGGAQKGEGFEFHLLVLAIALALMIKGGGTASIDKWISGKK